MNKPPQPQRVDELERYYNPIEKCNRLVAGLFLGGALLSVAVLYSDYISYTWLQQILTALFILVVLSHAVLSHYNSFFLIPSVEEIRRKQLLSNAFDVPLTPEQTSRYYNNEIQPSIQRLGASVLENSLFAKNVCREMAKRERVRISIYTFIWIIALIYRNTDLELILILTQVLFSAEIFSRFIKIEILRYKNNTVYNGLYSYFMHQISSDQNLGIADILYWFASYESAKSAASIQQSSKIFHNLNPKLSKEWDQIRQQLHIN